MIYPIWNHKNHIISLILKSIRLIWKRSFKIINKVYGVKTDPQLSRTKRYLLNNFSLIISVNVEKKINTKDRKFLLKKITEKQLKIFIVMAISQTLTMTSLQPRL